MPYALTPVPFASAAPALGSLRETMEHVTGQNVTLVDEQSGATLSIDGFECIVEIEVLDARTWRTDLNCLHPYVTAALRRSLSNLGGDVRGRLADVRPWAQTPRWPYRVRRGLRIAATPLFIAVELAAFATVGPILLARDQLRKARSASR